VYGHRARDEKVVAVMRTIHDVIKRLRAEYLQLPGLRLTAEQVQRLCGIERMMCQSVLDALVNAGFLCARSDGTYTRVTEGVVASRAAKADIAATRRSAKTS
jgi:hypothetical protein